MKHTALVPSTAVVVRATLATLAVAFAMSAGLAAQQGPKIYISADMEGVTGVVTGDQLGPTGFEYQRFREFMTNEVLAAIEAARAAGASEILVSDSHGNGENIFIDRLPDDVQIVRSWPRPLMMMQGIDDTFDGAIFIGYHASTTNPEGVRAHTMSSANLAAVRLNGVEMPEGGINAAIAGHFGVPILMVSGDDAAVSEVSEMLGGIGEAVVKWNYGFHSARTLTPAAGERVIREAVGDAVRDLEGRQPFVLEIPIQVEVTFKNYMPAEMLAYLRGVDRTDAHTVTYRADDMIDASRFLAFIGRYQPGLTP
ncbi:MAG: M55 family metallopeptidase [Gemmatimonadota bacterium]